MKSKKIFTLLIILYGNFCHAQFNCSKDWSAERVDDKGNVIGKMVVSKIPDIKKLLLNKNSLVNLDVEIEDVDWAEILNLSADCKKGANLESFSKEAIYSIRYNIVSDNGEVASFSQNGMRLTELTHGSRFQGQNGLGRPLYSPKSSTPIYFNRNHWDITREKVVVEALITDLTPLPNPNGMDMGAIIDKPKKVSWEFNYDSKMAINCPAIIVNFPQDIATNIVAHYENNILHETPNSPKAKAYTYRLEPDIDMNGKFDDYKNSAIIEIFPSKTPLFTLNDVRPQFLMQWDLQSLNDVTEFLFPIGNSHTFIIGSDGLFIDTHGGLTASDSKYYKALDLININAGRMGSTLEQDYICKGGVVPNRKIITKRLENLIWDGRSFPQSVDVTVTKQ